MQHDVQKAKRNRSLLVTFLSLLSFIIPFIALYCLDPSSFETTWKGRTHYLFFLWLFFLEAALNWKDIQTSKISRLRSIRTTVFGLALLLPTIYIFVGSFLGLNPAIITWSKQTMGTWWAGTMPLSIEYVVLGGMFVLTNLIVYGKKGIANFSISTSLLFAIGAVYLIDNFYPNGTFGPFELIVPTTTTLAANFLNILGYQTSIVIKSMSDLGTMPYLTVWDPKNRLSSAGAYVGWQCAGVESLIIYTVTILLFLKKSAIPLRHRAAYFVIGAVITYFINILRIATILIIAMNEGELAFRRFHEYYGQLYSITWIISYPLIIIGSQLLWSKIRFYKKE